MKNLTTSLLFLFAFTAYSQKTFLDFRNESSPTYPGCENAENREECYTQKVGEIILTEVNASDGVKGFENRIEVHLQITNMATGKLNITKLTADDPAIVQLARKALDSLPPAEPSFNPTDGEPVTSTAGFVVVLERQTGKDAYSLANNSKTGKYRKQPHPFAGYVSDVVYPGCEGAKPEQLRQCLTEKFAEWLIGKADPKLVAEYKGTGGAVKVTFDDKGNLKKYKVFCNAEAVKAEFERVLATHPKVKPGKADGEPSELSYWLPFTL